MNNQFQNNNILGPVNSWLFKKLSGYMDHLFGQSKRKLFESHPKTVVEIGPGAGANMRYLDEGTRLIAIEPNKYMHANLRKSATKYGIELEIKTISGEAIDLPDACCEFVVGTLVLCSVENPMLCINQIIRILKPSGVFVFLEHVKAEDNMFLTLIQKVLHKPWHWFFEGCHTNRDTRRLLQNAGFSSLQLESYNKYSPFIPIIPQIRGKAVK